jgi:hypothetical protein
MPYSVVVWLVNPGRQQHEEETVQAGAERERNSGASSGVNIPPAFTRFSYGLYESRERVEVILTDIADRLQQNAPLHVVRGDQLFVIPASRVHYVACKETERPVDRRPEHA